MFRYLNLNPALNDDSDCVVRAIALATGKSWEEVYDAICDYGRAFHRMPDNNGVWASYLADLGFHRYLLHAMCPTCYTVRDFCQHHPVGVFVLGTGDHVVTAIDGDYYDTWDSGDKEPIFIWTY